MEEFCLVRYYQVFRIVKCYVKQEMTNFFRGLVLVNLIAFLVWYALPWFDEPFLSEQTINVLSWYGYEAIINVPAMINYFLLSAAVVIEVGLCFFIRISRPLFLILIVGEILLIPFQGLHVETGISRMLGAFVGVLDGAIIVMTFLPPIGNKFSASTT